MWPCTAELLVRTARPTQSSAGTQAMTKQSRGPSASGFRNQFAPPPAAKVTYLVPHRIGIENVVLNKVCTIHQGHGATPRSSHLAVL
jgi:hypothetical protein